METETAPTQSIIDLDLNNDDITWCKQVELCEKTKTKKRFGTRNCDDDDYEDSVMMAQDTDDNLDLTAACRALKINVADDCADHHTTTSSGGEDLFMRNNGERASKRPRKTRSLTYDKNRHQPNIKIKSPALALNENHLTVSSKDHGKTLKMSYDLFENVIKDNFVIFVDMQFVGTEVVEIAICRPDMPCVFHDAYPICQIFKPNRPSGVLAQAPNNARTNSKTIENNLRYVNMNCCYDKNRYHSLPMKNNYTFFASLPDNAVYVLRGINKHSYWQNLLDHYNKRGTIYLFWKKFYNPNEERMNNHSNNRGQRTCIHHTNPYSACSLANVRQMALYYHHCEYMFF